ncbi:MAG TPA: hypothetical protein DCX08_03730, partial [Porticoccaceae bacterium]|nr:hypothetical protein [Porticoccaceae bacterium]
MNRTKFFKLNSIAAAVVVGSFMAPAIAFAQDGLVEEIVTTGSRVKARSATETPAPVDVINASELANQG